MRRALLVLTLAAAAAVVAAGARTDGPQGPSPGVSAGWAGVLATNGKVRYVAVPGGRWTILEAVQVHGGRVLRWAELRGTYGHPLVALDGTTGGLSADGKTLVLASFATSDGISRFRALTTRTMRLGKVVALRGPWSFDAMSPDASTLFLIQYLGTGIYPAYRVRAYDMNEHRLVPGAIVDRREEEAAMRGQPVTRRWSSDGRWAYTLYARQGEPPFVHALDTVARQAYCIDLPIRLRQPKQMALRLRLRSDGKLAVRSGPSTLAVVDTTTFEARKG
jgi:hypothetical protein